MIKIKYVMAMIRPEKLDAIKKELSNIVVNGLTVSSVAGYGSQEDIWKLIKLS